MLNRIDDIEILADNPFANDLLDRQTIAENLATLVENTTTPYVMSISAPWGQGKTTFIKMWKQLLENRGFPTVYFDAWSSDYANDPLLSFIGSIEASIRQDDTQAQKALEKVKGTFKKVIRASPKIAMNWALRGGLHYVTDGEASAKDEIDAAANIAAELVDQEMAQHLTIRQLLDDFGERLSELGATLSTDGKPLIILIDELDRCRPDYAVELLERIKHLFAVPNLLIVLSVDIEKLGQSASQIIGFQSANADGYLRRFIDLDYRLPEASLEKLFDTHLLNSDLPEGYAWGDLNKWLACLARLRELSARDCLHVVNRFAATAKSFPNYIEGIKRFLPVVALEAYHDYSGMRRTIEDPGSATERLKELMRWRNAVNKEQEYEEWYARDWILTMYAAWFVELIDGIMDENEKDEARRWARGISSHRGLPPKSILLEMISYSRSFS